MGELVKSEENRFFTSFVELKKFSEFFSFGMGKINGGKEFLT